MSSLLPLFDERLPLPTYLQIEPVGQCNLRCQMCPIQFRQDGPPHGPPAFMKFDLFGRIIDQFPMLEHLHLQGLGEPMMHPQFFEMVEYAVDRGVRVTTNTNLTLLNARKAARCIDCRLACLHISVDGASAETYERIRLRGHFDRVLHNIEMVVAARERHQCQHPELRMVVVLMRQNLVELTDLVHLAARLGFSSIFVQHLCHDFGESTLPPHYFPMREFISSQMLSNDDERRVRDVFREATEAAEAHAIELRLPSPERLIHPPERSGPDRCRWPWTGAYVSYQGLAMPCCMVATPDRATVGDMNRSTAEEIWNGEPYQSFRQALTSHVPPEICQSCSVYHGTF